MPSSCTYNNFSTDNPCNFYSLPWCVLLQSLLLMMMMRMVYWSAVNQFVHISNNLIGVKKSVMSFVVGNNDEEAATTIHGAIKYSSACGHSIYKSKSERLQRMSDDGLWSVWCVVRRWMEINKCTFDSAFPITNDEKWNGFEIFTSNFIKWMSQWTRLFIFHLLHNNTQLQCTDGQWTWHAEKVRVIFGRDLLYGLLLCFYQFCY